MTERIAHIKHYCQTHSHKQMDSSGYIVTNHKRSIGYCPVPKCSSSSFLYLMQTANKSSTCGVLNSNTVVYPLDKCGIHKVFFRRPLSPIPFLFSVIRNPFDRIVSMYYDKVVNRDKTFDTFRRYVHQMYGRQKANENQTEVIFTRYVDFLLDLWLGRSSYRPRFHERFHVFPYTQFCDFCRLDYKFIARLETKDRDFLVLAEKIGHGTSVKNLNKNFNKVFPASSAQKYRKEWIGVTASKRDALYEMYKHDFEMFGYHYDRTHNSIECFINSENGRRCC